MINSYKAKKLKVKSDFKEGDKVWVKIKEKFRKGSEPRFSDKVYIVESVNGLRITLDNDKTYLESNLIKTDLEKDEANIINKTIKENSISRTLKKNIFIVIILLHIQEGRNKYFNKLWSIVYYNIMVNFIFYIELHHPF